MPDMNSKTEKRKHRITTLVALIFSLGVYFAMCADEPDGKNAGFAPYFLVIMLGILGGRALLTELGVRRRRYPLERRIFGGQ